MLTREQQQLAEQALELVPVVLVRFKQRYSCFASLWNQVDLEGAAHMAITMAARTFDPQKAGVSAYFSRAIINSCLSAIDKEVKANLHSPWRISLAAAEHRQTQENNPLADPMLTAIQNLSEEDRRVIEERVFDGKSIRAFAREWGISTRQARKQIMCRLDRLADHWRESPYR